jgi:hypothetical protein
MIKVCEVLSNATRTMRFPNVLFHLDVFDNYHGMCEESRDGHCHIPTFSLIKAWNRTEHNRWSNEIVVPQFVFLPTTMYMLPWKDKTPIGEGARWLRGWWTFTARCLLPAECPVMQHRMVAAAALHGLVQLGVA